LHELGPGGFFFPAQVIAGELANAEANSLKFRWIRKGHQPLAEPATPKAVVIGNDGHRARCDAWNGQQMAHYPVGLDD
jgi:glyoxylate utilization-related uncharacterized protein